MEDTITHDYITEYLRGLLPERSALLTEIEQMAEKEETYAPIVQPEVAQLLAVTMSSLKPKRVLEVGTAIGYSAIFMSQYLAEGGEIITLERYEKMVRLATENIKKAGLEGTIHIRFGEALESLEEMEGSFDMIFLDAAKGQYPQFLPHCLRLLRSGGILFSDNVLYRGMVASQKLVVRRKITIVKRLRTYLKTISEHPLLESSIIPIGDGVAISYKK